MKFFCLNLFKFSTIIFYSITACEAADGKWSESFGQGNFEYSIEVKKHRIFINCPTENGNADSPSSVEFSEGGKDLKVFEISVNGKKYKGPFESSSRVGANNFTSLLDDLKKSDATVTFKDTSIIFPKSNASSVLPTFGKKGFVCNLDEAQSQTPTSQAGKSSSSDRPPNPLVYGTCYGAIVGWAKKSQGGLIPNQRAVDFHKTWQPYAAQVSSAAIKAGGCVGNYTDAQLLQCYKKRLSDERDANFQFAYNLGIEAVMEAPGGSAGAASLAQNQCSQLIAFDNKPKASSSPASSSANSSRPSSGTITRIDTSTGNVAISGFSRVTVGKSTSITVNGNRVKNEGDLMVGDRCTVRMESYDLYAQNLVCSR